MKLSEILIICPVVKKIIMNFKLSSADKKKKFIRKYKINFKKIKIQITNLINYKKIICI